MVLLMLVGDKEEGHGRKERGRFRSPRVLETSLLKRYTVREYDVVPGHGVNLSRY